VALILGKISRKRRRRFDKVVELLQDKASKKAVLDALGDKRPHAETHEVPSGPPPRVNWLHLACHFDLLANTLLLARCTASQAACCRESDLSMEEVSTRVRLARSCTAVLSACNTGRGSIVSEGVVGLSRGFLAAGAAAVVSSLWKISDESTGALMAFFYRELLRGKSVPYALRVAMLSLIETKGWMAAPVYWAGFMVVGASTSLPEAP